MTMALVYRNKDEAFFLQDFRITHTGGKQIDAMMKYFSFGEQIGMFFAGDVAAVKRLIPHIRLIEAQINISNILDSNGPLARTIESYMMSNPDGLTGIRKVEIIGFIIEHETKNNECFYVNGQVGMGSSITGINHNEVKVIGSGSKIDNISLRLTNIANQVIKKDYDIETALESTRTQVKSIFQRTGVSAYNKLGISPVFAGSLLRAGYFEMMGGAVTGERFTTDFGPNGANPHIEFDYSLTHRDGNIVLVNNNSGEEIVVKEVEDYTERPVSELFDPEGLTRLFDPTLYANSNGVVYIINQWVIDDRHILRTIDKTNLEHGICNPDYIRLISSSIETESLTETSRYILSGDHGLIIPVHLQSTFEDDLSQHLFDHNWLSSYVENYHEIYE